MGDLEQPSWPLVLFDDERRPAAVGASTSIYNVRETQDLGEIHAAFDSKFRKVKITPRGPFDFRLELSSSGPQTQEFRVRARIAYRLYGPLAQWRRSHLAHGDPTDTTEWSADELWLTLANRYWVD